MHTALLQNTVVRQLRHSYGRAHGDPLTEARLRWPNKRPGHQHYRPRSIWRWTLFRGNSFYDEILLLSSRHLEERRVMLRLKLL